MNIAEASDGGGKGAIAAQWWGRFCHPKKGDAAIRARLRRCRSNAQVLGIPAAIYLLRRLGVLAEVATSTRVDASVDTALGLARVLSHVSEDTGVSPMRLLGWPSPPIGSEADADPSKRPRLSEVRFRRLLQVGSGEEQVAAFTRLVKLAGGEVGVAMLSRDYLRWYRDTTKHRWAFEYYAATSAAPATAIPTQETTA